MNLSVVNSIDTVNMVKSKNAEGIQPQDNLNQIETKILKSVQALHQGEIHKMIKRVKAMHHVEI